jgi:hypothetical protein
MGKSKSKKYLKKKKADTDTDTNTNTDTDTDTDTVKSKNNKEKSGLIDYFFNLSNKTKTYLAIITMLLIFAAFIWYKQNKSTNICGEQLNVQNNVGTAIQQNLENIKESVNTLSQLSQMSQISQIEHLQ